MGGSGRGSANSKAPVRGRAPGSPSSGKGGREAENRVKDAIEPIMSSLGAPHQLNKISHLCSSHHDGPSLSPRTQCNIGVDR